MALTRSRVKSLVKRKLIKELEVHDFKEKPAGLGCFRVRGDFFDVVSIQIGKSPGSLYLHFFMNLVTDPLADSLDGYRVGRRLDRNPQAGNVWFGETEEEVVSIVDDMLCVAVSEALEFFDGVADQSAYVKEILDGPSRLIDFDLAVAFAGAGKLDKVPSLCSETIERVQADEDFEEDECEQICSAALDLQRAARDKQTDALLARWRREKLVEVGL